MSASIRQSRLSTGGGTTNATISVPNSAGGLQIGSVLRCVITTTANQTITPNQTGWTQVYSTINRASSTGSFLAEFYRVVSGSEPASYTFALGGISAYAGVITELTGVDTTNPLGGSGTTLGGSSGVTSLTANSINATVNDGLLFYSAGQTYSDNAGGATSGAPGGMNRVQEGYGTSSSRSTLLSTAQKTLSSSGATGAFSEVASRSGEYVAALTVYRAAGVGGAPVVNAGADQSLPYDSSITLSGTASDPDNDLATTTWSQISGPGTATITSPSNLSTSVTLPVTGVYIFRLSATDSASHSTTDDIIITGLPSNVRVSSTNGSASPASVNFPSGIADGDTCIFILIGAPGMFIDVPPTPSGWTAILLNNNGTSSNGVYVYTFSKRYSSGDATPSIVLDGVGSKNHVAIMVAIRNLHTISPISEVWQGSPLTTLSGLSGVKSGASGSTTYRYKVCAYDISGNGPLSSIISVANGSNTLSSVNFITVYWQRTIGCDGYKVFKETSDGSGVYGLVGTVAQGPGLASNDARLTFKDDGSITPGIVYAAAQGIRINGGEDADFNGFQLKVTHAGGRLLLITASQSPTADVNQTITLPTDYNQIISTIGPVSKLVGTVSIKEATSGEQPNRLTATPSVANTLGASLLLLLRKNGFSGLPEDRFAYPIYAAAGSTTTLYSMVHDRDKDRLTYSWTQLSGTSVALTNSTTAYPTLSPPKGMDGTLIYRLTATDPDSNLVIQDVTVRVSSRSIVKQKKSDGSLAKVRIKAKKSDGSLK